MILGRTDQSGAPRLLCTRTRIASLAAIPHIPYDMCETDSPCAARDHERLRTARRLAATYGGIGAAWLEASPRQSRHYRRPFRGAPSAGHESRLRGTRIFTKWRQPWFFVSVRVGRQARIRVRRACRARQGAADAPRRTRRSLKTARDADAADRRRRFDMPCRRSWSRASAKFSAPLRETKLECQGLRPRVSGFWGKEVKGLGQNPDSPGQRP